MNNFLIIFIIMSILVSCKKSKDATPNSMPSNINIQSQAQAQAEAEAEVEITPYQEIEIKRLSPDAFPSLPEEIRKFLTSGEYTIPQAAEETLPHNVISGPFFTENQLDWAVLASRAGESEILIFHNGSTQTVSHLAKDKDDDLRKIHAASPAYIIDHYEAYSGPKPPVPLNHYGIDDGMVGKGSMIRYFYDQQWSKLQGAD